MAIINEIKLKTILILRNKPLRRKEFLQNIGINSNNWKQINKRNGIMQANNINSLDSNTALIQVFGKGCEGSTYALREEGIKEELYQHMIRLVPLATKEYEKSVLFKSKLFNDFVNFLKGLDSEELDGNPLYQTINAYLFQSWEDFMMEGKNLNDFNESSKQAYELLSSFRTWMIQWLITRDPNKMIYEQMATGIISNIVSKRNK